MDEEIKKRLRTSLINSLESFDYAHSRRGESTVDSVLGYVRGILRGRTSTLNTLGLLTIVEAEYIDKIIGISTSGNFNFPPRPLTLTKDPTP